MKAFILILTYHSDPGHGWIEVPAALVDRLGILNDITEYSYYSHDRQVYYLEEDCDAGTLINALKAQGYEYVLKPMEHKTDAFLRKTSRVGGASAQQ